MRYKLKFEFKPKEHIFTNLILPLLCSCFFFIFAYLSNIKLLIGFGMICILIGFLSLDKEANK